ncbi:hypothetical protein RJ641_012789 [Dillenia turbinata]|uniref:Uncharacterized protein n=1 Tax=Dillenia turbinata TaxID=194707 RepID=A0AAN8V400_9MAGN
MRIGTGMAFIPNLTNLCFVRISFWVVLGTSFPCNIFNYAATWTDKYKDRGQTRSGSTTNQLPSSRDFLGDFLVWRPPVGLEKSPAFWVFLTFWICLVGTALIIQQ